MSVLSEEDVIEELGKEILIYPFRRANLTGGCLSLTSSEYIYSLSQKDLLRVQVMNSQKFFLIPKRDSVLVWTNESVSLGDSLCGSIHSRVSLASKGIGHIGTRVNPNWTGILCIALHNICEFDVQLDVGETIAYLRFHQLTSKSSTPRYIHEPGRFDVIPEGYPIPIRLREWANDKRNMWRKGNEKSLKEALAQSKEYQEVKSDLHRRSNSYRLTSFLKRWAASLAVTLLLFIYFLLNGISLTENIILALIPITYTIVSEIVRDLR